MHSRISFILSFMVLCFEKLQDYQYNFWLFDKNYWQTAVTATLYGSDYKYISVC